MIYVSQQQLDEVEYLLQQSSQGNHVLFDAETIRRVLSRDEDFTEDDAYAVEHHIERLLQQPTLREKHAYLERLDARTHDRVVRTYLNIVENHLYENVETRH